MIPRSNSEYLYVHVPFCAHICSYCDFARTVYLKKNVSLWLEALRKELNGIALRKDLKTIYLGGGTPTCLDEEELDTLLSLLDPYSGNLIEYTAEVNPETLNARKAEILRAHGVNRASVGMQTDDPGLLKLLGRRHTADDVSGCVRLLRSAGINNISLDLMYSLPNQTMKQLETATEYAIGLNPEHLSLYSLTIEENSVFGRKGISALDEETEADMYEWICRKLESEGFHQYEISNFAKDGYESVHNRGYWTYRDFCGISCGAAGKEGLVRYEHSRLLKDYIGDPLSPAQETLSEEEAMFEMVMMNLRLKEGMKLSQFEETFGIPFQRQFANKADRLIRQGLLEEEDGFIRCSSRGFHILNSVLVELM